jgi:hypothetical protein
MGDVVDPGETSGVSLLSLKLSSRMFRDGNTFIVSCIPGAVTPIALIFVGESAAVLPHRGAFGVFGVFGVFGALTSSGIAFGFGNSLAPPVWKFVAGLTR